MVWRSVVLERVVSSIVHIPPKRWKASCDQGSRTWPGGAAWELGRQGFNGDGSTRRTMHSSPQQVSSLAASTRHPPSPMENRRDGGFNTARHCWHTVITRRHTWSLPPADWSSSWRVPRLPSRLPEMEKLSSLSIEQIQLRCPMKQPPSPITNHTYRYQAPTRRGEGRNTVRWDEGRWCLRSTIPPRSSLLARGWASVSPIDEAS